MTLSGCLSEGSRGRDCGVLYVLCRGFKEVDINLKFGLCKKILRGVVKGLGLWGS